MALLTPLLSGFIAAFIGIIPPGLINMTAAKINLKEGKKNALWFVIGAVLVIFFQVFVAVLFAQVIDNRPDVVTLLREVGFVIFAFLTIYFLFLAKEPKTKKKSKIKKSSKKSRFFLGMLLSGLNFFPIPYYVVVSVTLASYHLFVFENNIIFTFVLGSVLGSFAALYSYVAFFGRIEKKTDYLMRNMNTIIGSITGLIAVVTLFNILNYYFG
ncbi:LysE family transporter [Flavobacterium sp. MMLR14_040]|uniref:Lysine transporter LysE n=1 Tax=Flavobacterium pectinovorum TaxID=29533 RepID=A0AB36P233_9FLAO|nr:MULTISPECIES: LysE family transporter [Flavobacterium]MDW8849830.1 LysE family transporter [Flavobacterium sp. MMLR14_040]OXB05727.1 lysine transporter LysE [Flavobacterium pectinovorum]SHM08599.1 Threonine/homoserine/homoserine lactone efflux protein [Flavobacterium pectinovorum]